MTGTAIKKKSAPLPQAVGKNHWVACALVPEVHNDAGQRMAPASLSVAYVRKGFHSKIGLGNARLDVAQVPVRDDGSVLAATLTTCTGVGTGTHLNRAAVEELVAEAPKASEAYATFKRTLRALNVLDSMPVRRVENYWALDGWQHSGIVPVGMPYGFCYLPKAAAVDLEVTEGQVPDDLRFTHVLVNLLEQKHALMASLGLHDAIELDKKKVANSLKLLEVA